MTKKSLLEFPCNFPIKIVGMYSEVFIAEAKEVICKHFPQHVAENMTLKPSKNNNYIALSILVLAQNQEMLDAFYTEISKHPLVKMVL